MRALLAQFRLRQCGDLAKRRPFFQAIKDGVDIQAAKAVYGGTSLSPAQAAFLRVFQSGDAVPQTVAAKWSGEEICLHCRLAPESLAHRLHECPRWDEVRRPVLDGQSMQALLAEVGPAALHGLVPSARPAPWQPGRVGPAMWPKRRELPERVWMDGSAYETTDVTLAVAAWAVVSLARDGALETLAAAAVQGE